MSRIYLPYFVSGFVSLAYQICWYRLFVDRLGANSITFVLVLCSFIGGIAVGSAVSRGATERLRPRLGGKDDLSLYGRIELLVTATALGLFVFAPLPNHLVGHFPYVLRGNVYQPVAIYQVYKVMAVVLCVFIPCFFMGITFPLLCATFKDLPDFPSRLYAWNTFGACTGVLVCEFVLIRCFGTTATFCIALAMNGLLGVVFAAFGARIREGIGPAAAPPPKDEETPAQAETSPLKPMPQATAVTCAVLSGLLSGGLEADVMRRLLLWEESLKIAFSFLVFWAIFAIFLASGSIRRHRSWRFTMIKVLFGAAFVYHLAASSIHVPIRKMLGPFVWMHVTRDIYSVGLVQVFVLTGVAIFPSYFCISLLLPHVCNRCQQDRRHLGWVYGMNTAAFCAGVLLFGWIAPLVSPFYSLRVFIGLFALCVVYLFTLREALPPRRLLLAPVGAAALLIVLLSPRSFDRNVFHKEDLRRLPILAWRSDGAHLVFIVQLPDFLRMYFDAHPMSGTDMRSLRYMKLMAHFPLLAQPSPRRALLICFGLGNTAKAIADHSSIERLDTVDLTTHVFDLAHHFDATNHQVYKDDRVRLIHDDGRNFLNLTDETYDLITSEPPPPCNPGIGRLYSLEYYEACKRHLTPNGIVSQWLPVYQLTPEMAERMVETFRRVFPETMIFVGHGSEFIMLGSMKPIDLACVEKHFMDDEAVVADLKGLGVSSPVHLLARILQVDETIDTAFSGRPVITDEKNFLEYAVTTLLRPRWVVNGETRYAGAFDGKKPGLDYYHPLPLLKMFKAQGLTSYEELVKVLQSPETLRSVAPDFPLGSPAGVPVE